MLIHVEDALCITHTEAPAMFVACGYACHPAGNHGMTSTQYSQSRCSLILHDWFINMINIPGFLPVCSCRSSTPVWPVMRGNSADAEAVEKQAQPVIDDKARGPWTLVWLLAVIAQNGMGAWPGQMVLLDAHCRPACVAVPCVTGTRTAPAIAVAAPPVSPSTVGLPCVTV
ncbi:hypothetical protein ABZP36_029308 [Zizania latifolia]